MIVSAVVTGSAALSVYTHAGSSTSTMNVSASVRHSCSMGSSPMAFGAYDGIVANSSTALEATATIVSTCTSGAAAIITINAGASEGSDSADASARRMTDGERNYLAYQVYSDVGRSRVWGNTAPTGVARLPDLASLKLLRPTVESWQRKQRPKEFTGTSSASQLLTDADTITGTGPLWPIWFRGSGIAIITFIGRRGNY